MITKLTAVTCMIVILMITLTASANGQDHLLKARGLELSKRLCINCHIVDSSSNPVIGDKAPSFRAIANSPDQTRERLAGKIIIPHPDMPNIPLTRYEIRDIITYIMSLKTAQ